MTQWTLSKSSFDNFLAILDDDRNRAGRKYEDLRARLVKYFEWRACREADALADETLDRVARKAEAGEAIRDHLHYAFGVARLVYLEAVKKEARQQAKIIALPTAINPAAPDEENPSLDCLEKCLKTLSDTNRLMILHYYRQDKRAKIDYRQALAERLGMTLNALRIKTLRIRARLEECVSDCLNNS